MEFLVFYIVGVLAFVTAFYLIDHQDGEGFKLPSFKEIVDYVAVSLLWPIIVAKAVINKAAE